MSEDNEFFVTRKSDNILISDFKEFFTKFKPYISHVLIELRTGEQINFNLSEPSFSDWLSNKSLSLIAASQNYYVVARIVLDFKNYTLTYTRGEKSKHKSSLFDCVYFTNFNNSNQSLPELTPQLKIEILQAIQEKLCPISTFQQISTSIPKEYDALISVHSTTLSKLEALSTNLIEKHNAKLQELEQTFLNRSKSLNEEHNKKIFELDTNLKLEKEKLYSEIKTEKEILNGKYKELEIRSSKLDDRDNTHVRREIRDKMLEDVKKRVDNFGVSSNTNKKRLPVYQGIMFLIALFFGLLAFTIYQLITIISKNDSFLYWMWLKLTLTTLGLTGSIIYYIKWQNRWADYHATSEFQLQQFQIDINRANWVLESCLEWYNETKTEIPSVLLEQISKNLFVGENKNLEKVIHPSDELASALLGSASKLKMNVGGNEIELKNPGKIKPRTLISDE